MHCEYESCNASAESDDTDSSPPSVRPSPSVCLCAAKYYSAFEHEEKRQLEAEVHRLVTKRDPKFTNFIEVRYVDRQTNERRNERRAGGDSALHGVLSTKRRR